MVEKDVVRRWWRTASAATLIVVGFAGCRPVQPALPEIVPVPLHVDAVVVEKGKRRLVLLENGRPIRQYVVALGPNPVGPKTMEGDGRTPEGRYLIDWRNPNSRYHLALHVSYPSLDDLDRAAQRKVPPGGDIMIHGLPNDQAFWGADHARWDWTAGCIAVSNEEIEEIWSLVPDGTPIDIRP